MAGRGYVSDMGAVEPNKSLLAELLDPVQRPVLETTQTAGQGSTLHEHAPPHTHTRYDQSLYRNKQSRSSHMSKVHNN